MRRGLMIALLALGLAPAAQAATVTRITETVTVERSSWEVVRHIVTVDAVAGEVNAVTVTAQPRGVIVHDAGAPLAPGPGCAAVDAATVRCPTRRRADETYVRPVLRLGDGDDRATIAGDSGRAFLFPDVEGGDGADEITGTGILAGGPGDDRLTGTTRGESMSGGPGADVLLGLGGHDVLVGDTAPADGNGAVPQGDDHLDGGPGRDRAGYAGRRAPVTIDLRGGIAGAAGERDVLAGVEDALGGDGADTIIGTAGANELNGYAGADVIRALAGDDIVEGGAHVDAGAGDDILVDPPRRLDCGPGIDVVDRLRYRSVLPEGCERVSLARGLTADARPRLIGGNVAVTLRWTCRCRYVERVAIWRGGTLLARGRITVGRAPRGGERRVTARLALRAGVRRGAEIAIAFRASGVRFPARLS